MPDQTPADLLKTTIAADPARPLVTFYDDATGERIELSGKTFGNWVAKTANLLVDGLDAQPGERVALALPPHWQTAVWLFSCWSAGLVVVPGPVQELTDVQADVLVVSEDLLPASREHPAAASAREVVGLSLNAFGAPLADCPPGVVDYATEVRSYGDEFLPYDPVDPGEPAVTVRNATFSGAELVRRAREAAENWQLDTRSRVLTDLSPTTVDELLAALLAPLSANGSVIIQRNLDIATLDRRISLEHVTAVAGMPGQVERTASVRRLL
ncbi:MAG: hypothetical protein JWO67_6430 [Streptosporangiaceae bacterium]|jgi:uncharacterized protein (TIGR03089 family)|nr:hypothetical protein [Streptosporangiaceae bacterium]